MVRAEIAGIDPEKDIQVLVEAGYLLIRGGTVGLVLLPSLG